MVAKPLRQKKGGKKIKRRFFFKKTSTAVILGGALAYGLASAPLLRSKQLRLRPPGALEEKVFLASCIKCGQCLQVCPPQVVKLAGIKDGFGIGAPYIIPRKGACILCQGLPCVLACPTGALDHKISEGKEAEMGLAVLSSPETCLARLNQNDIVHELEQLLDETSSGYNHESKNRSRRWNRVLIRMVNRIDEEESRSLAKKFDVKENGPGPLLRRLKKLGDREWRMLLDFARSTGQARTGCRVCLDECPISEEHPIRFDPDANPETGEQAYRPVVGKTCVGCGVCEERCPTAVPSITIVARKKWQPSLT